MRLFENNLDLRVDLFGFKVVIFDGFAEVELLLNLSEPDRWKGTIEADEFFFANAHGGLILDTQAGFILIAIILTLFVLEGADSQKILQDGSRIILSDLALEFRVLLNCSRTKLDHVVVSS